MWLEENGHKDLVKVFVKNNISGEQLISLNDADLVAMKIDKVGVRKTVLKQISALAVGEKSSATAATSNVEGHEDDSSMSSSTSSRSAVSGLQFKVTPEGNVQHTFHVTLNPDGPVSFSKLMRKLERKLGFQPSILCCMDGNELHPVEDQQDWAPLWSRLRDAQKGCELKVRRPHVNDISKPERALLDTLVDAAVLASSDMTILFVNKHCLKLTGYSPEELIGKNVKTLMPESVAKVHDLYVKQYLDTLQAKVIGKGRHVEVRKKDGTSANCWLSVTEQKKASGRHTFLGTLHEMHAKQRGDALVNFSVLDAIQKVVVVMDSTGTLKFLNRHAEGLLGFGEEAVGSNIRIIMPEPYASSHNNYVQNYIKSGKAKVIGRGFRTVVAQRKDGSVVAVELAVDEVSLDGVRHFVGVMTEVHKTQQEQRSLLQDTRGVVNSLSVPAVVIDKKGIIQAFNAKAESMLGFSMVDVLGEKVNMLMNEQDAAKHDSYIEAYLKTGNAKVIGKTRTVLTKTVTGALVPAVLSISKNQNPEDPDDFLFTGILVQANVDKSGKESSESTSYGAAERNIKQMNSLGENTVVGCAAVKDFGVAENANQRHRSSMEDSWIMVDAFGGVEGSAFFAIFDGHNGTNAAEFSMAQLHLFLSRYRRGGKFTLPEQFEKAYRATHDAMGSEIGKSGCTVVSVLLDRAAGQLHVANAGDSRAILVKQGGAVERLSKDHKPSDPDEKRDVEARGGIVVNNRVSGILGVSRCLGDYRAEKYVSRSPSFKTVSLAKTDCALLLACDGLFDVLTDQDVAQVVTNSLATGTKAEKICKILCDMAINKGSTDNVTVMLVLL